MTEPVSAHRYAYVRADDPDRFGAELVTLLDAIDAEGGTLVHLSTQAVPRAGSPDGLRFVGQVAFRPGFGAASVVDVLEATSVEPQPGIEEQVAAIVEGVR